jgi:SAM-dependent methyltransferase
MNIDTYKSIWTIDSEGNYVRTQKTSYPLEKIIPSFLYKVPKVRGIADLLGRKEQGENFYKYYSMSIEAGLNGDRGKWKNEFSIVQNELNGLVDINGLNVLDISGEPGFFGYDAKMAGNNVLVTAFAEEVASSITLKLSVDSVCYDFNKHNIDEVVNKKFDIVFIRYAIGFCLDLKKLTKQLKNILQPNGLVYVSFSPASRAIMARWMFDDYTYLVCSTKNNMIESFQKIGFFLKKEINHGSYRWDKNMHLIQKLLSQPFIGKIFRDVGEDEKKQHNVALVFRL